MRVVVAMTLAGLALTACGIGQEQTAVTTQGSPGRTASPDSTPRRCDSDGGETDLDREPDYSARDRLHRWANAEGCAVRLDVLMTREGPEHCGWQSVRTLLMGTPLDAPRTPTEYRAFIRDAEGVHGDAFRQHLHLSADLPEGAEDTGYRQAEGELWMRPDDDSYAYIVHPNYVEAWPNPAAFDKGLPGCA